MSLVVNQELKCYSKIIDCYEKNKTNSDNSEYLKNKSIIQIIKNSKCKQDQDFVQNALMLVLSLYETHPVDCYSGRGNEIQSCNKEQKEKVLTHLLKELL